MTQLVVPGDASTQLAPSVDGDPGDFRINEPMSVTLDGIRAIAAQAVVVGHAISFFQVLPRLQPPFAPYMQNIGVVVFFVLSGFLIAYTVWRKRAAGPYGFRTYGVERFARIFSGFVPGLVFIALVDAAVILLIPTRYAYGDAFSVPMLLANLAMLQDHAFASFVSTFAPDAIAASIEQVETFGSGRPLWTLAIEWWIYMAFGWLVLSGATRSRHPLRYLAILLVVVAIPAFNLLGGRGNVLTMMWLAGALTLWLSVTLPVRWSVRTSYALALVLAGAAALRVFRTGNEYELAFACLIAGSLYFLISGLRRSSFRYPDRVARLVRFVAAYSLTLYVIHYTIIAAVIAVDPAAPRPALVVTSIMACNVIAAVIAWPTEMRHKRFATWLLARVPWRPADTVADRRRPNPASEPTRVET